MKFNIKKILSCALTAVMLFSAVAVLIPPVEADAVFDSSVAEDKLPQETVEIIVGLAANKYKFESAEDMLTYEMSVDGKRPDGSFYLDANGDELDKVALGVAGNYIDSVSNGEYTIYVNRYTGVMYYRNDVTGQMLVSNPYDVSTVTGNLPKEEIMSQIAISYFLTSASSQATPDLLSYTEAAKRSQIKVEKMPNGLRVKYTIGDTTTRFLLPYQITAERFEEEILIPAIEEFQKLAIELCSSENSTAGYEGKPADTELGTPADRYDFIFTDNVDDPDTLANEGMYKYGCVDLDALFAFIQEVYDIAQWEIGLSTSQLDELQEVWDDITILSNVFGQQIPEKLEAYGMTEKLENLKKTSPITADGTPVYLYVEEYKESTANLRDHARIVAKYTSGYTFQQMYKDEQECGYTSPKVQQPVFRCALEYTFNEDGSLSVSLPATSLIFDETVYTLKSIVPLKYFGAGDMTTDGYAFFPDGSGTVVDFEQFDQSGENISISSPVFGQDYCYATVTGAHREQVTMPVYGVVGEVKTNQTTKDKLSAAGVAAPEYVSNGYFAILEEGAPLANLGITSSGFTHKYANVYAQYQPYPYDEFDLSDTISVGSLGKYFITSESKYNGSYVTRFVMLTDDTVRGALLSTDEVCYPTTYVGMATYYRNYLKDRGVLTALAETDNDLPLYIEALGAMEIIEKIMTFPVTVSESLTNFEDIESMYEELADAKETMLEKAEYYDSLAEKVESIKDKSADDEALLKQYRDNAAECREHAENITNINFKLSGFANGGLTSTYPVKLRWEKVCGGKRGFNDLIDAAAEISKETGKNFGVYPDFDLMYVNSTATFDGINLKKTVSKMVDDRYASKQFYNSIISEYESFFNLIVSPDALGGLYEKFEKKYSKYDWKFVSFSTMGSDLNSNFNKKNPINRDDAMTYVKSTLEKASLGEYTMMLDKGNIYTVAYADHIIDANIDSSHFRYSSYTVPFWGLVVHSYVNYTGGAFNYAGSPDYELLRAIESGAALYFILCYQDTTSHLKEDPNLNKYYGVDYENWFEDIVLVYDKLNDEIGGLQNHEIVDHKAVIAERYITDKEINDNLAALIIEIAGFIKTQAQNEVNATYDSLANGTITGYDGLKVTFDIASLKARTAQLLYTTTDALDAVVCTVNGKELTGFDAILKELVTDELTAEYPALSSNQYEVNVNDFEYHYNDEADYTGEFKSQYRYVTGSAADSDNYRYTRYTTDSGNVVVVTYSHPTKGTKSFILNYNTFTVNVKIGNYTYTLEKYGHTVVKD